MSVDDGSELSNVPSTSLFDHNCSMEDFSANPDLVGSLTSFEEVCSHDPKKVAVPSESTNNSHPDSVSAILQESQAFLMKTSTTLGEYTGSARLKGEEYAKEVHTKASEYAAATQEQIHDYFQQFCSPEQKKAREDMTRHAVSILRSGLHSCHDGIDNMLVRMFDQEPIQVVELRTTSSMDQSGSISLNEDITIDSVLKRREMDGTTEIEASMYDAPSNILVKPRRARLEAKKCVDIRKQRKALRTQPRGDSEGPADETNTDPQCEALDLLSVPTTESDLESVLRFKQELYQAQFGAGGKTNDNALDETVAQEGIADVVESAEPTDDFESAADHTDEFESRNGSETLTSDSMEELDRLLRTDIEKLDRLVVKTIDKFSKVEQSSDNVPKVTTSTTSPQNLRQRHDLQGSANHFQEHRTSDPTLPTRYISSSKVTTVRSPIIKATAADSKDVIDLTMFDDEESF